MKNGMKSGVRHKVRALKKMNLPLGVSLAVSLCVGLGALSAASTVIGAPTIDPVESRILMLETQTINLLDRLANPRAEALPEPPVRVAQNSRATAQISVRLDALENQMRILNGQVEGLQFQLTQLQTLLAKMQEDNEFRFQELEGGSLGKTSAATPSGGEMPTSELPQELADDTNGEINGPLELGILEPEDALDGEGLDLTPEAGGQPFDLNVQSGAVVQDGDADAQYQAGFEAVTNGDYVFAEEQFRQFIALFPEHPNAANAMHWLGDVLLQRGQYEEAAELLLEGFELYPNSSKAPDILLKLGIALSKANERETACRTFVEALRRYPDRSRAYLRRIELEQKMAQC